MSLPPGTRIGPYEIVSMLGAGGMGEVYRARDTRLDRTVALKALPVEMLADDARRRRFLAEARAASALNHPNIVSIHDFAAANGGDFLVMEYVSGTTLQERIAKKGLRLNETLRYAIQIADALAAAHEAGIVHRDLKPGNVMVTPNGTIKLLDFGLAKLVEPDAWHSGDATRTTRTLPSVEGAIAGTVPYMSPEQAEGKPLDARSDIFSFGCVLYEMLTGQRAFQGDSAMSTLSAVLRSEPKPVTHLAPDVPHDVERVIRRCLRKDSERRFQTARDLKVALQELLDESSSGIPAVPVPMPKRNIRLWLAGALGLSLTTVFVLWPRLRPREQPAPITRESHLTAYEGFETEPAFSPDGQRVVFVWDRAGANSDIYVRLIGAGQPVPLTNTPEREFSPVWSPDGQWIAFFRGELMKATLFVMPSIGGGERKIAESGPTGVIGGSIRWSPDGRWLLVSGTTEKDDRIGVLLIDFSTREKRRLTSAPAPSADFGGSFSPDGRQIAFLRRHRQTQQGDIYLLNIDASFRAVGEAKRLAIEGSQAGPPVWTIDGRELVFRSSRAGRGGLWRISAAGGTPVRIPVTGTDPGEPAIQGTRLAYVQQVSDTNIWAMPTSGTGEAVQLVASTLNEGAPQYSPDGGRIAFCSDQSGSQEIWVARSDGSRPEKLTSFGSGRSCTPRWSPDSTQLVFDSNSEAAQFEIYTINADGGHPKRLTYEPATDAIGSFSGDGNWIYFMSARTGRNEIWKMPAAGGQPLAVTTNGGVAAFEKGDTLFFTKEGDGALWQMPAAAGRESKVLENVEQRNFMPVADGIYFTRRIAQGHSFQFHDFASRQVQSFGSTPRPISNGVTVSADGRWLAYAQQDRAGSDIVVIEHFR